MLSIGRGQQGARSISGYFPGSSRSWLLGASSVPSFVTLLGELSLIPRLNTNSPSPRAGYVLLSWLPSMRGGCQEGGPSDFECAPALVGVNVVRPAGRCTLTPAARRRGVAPVRAAGVAAAAGGGGSVVGAGPGSGWSEVPVSGGRPTALDNRVAPECPPGPVSCRAWASAASWR